MKPTFSVGFAYAVAIAATAAAFYFADVWTGLIGALTCVLMWRLFTAPNGGDGK